MDRATERRQPPDEASSTLSAVLAAEAAAAEVLADADRRVQAIREALARVLEADAEAERHTTAQALEALALEITGQIRSALDAEQRQVQRVAAALDAIDAAQLERVADTLLTRLLDDVCASPPPEAPS